MKENKKILDALQTGLPNTTSVGKVLIIGAGAAGLTAAQILYKSGVEVQIIEATSCYGGRVLTLTDFATSPVEAGAEEIHGGRTAWADLAELYKKDLIEHNDGYIDLFYIENELWSEIDAYSRQDFANLDLFYDALEEADFEETVGFISLQQFLDVIESPANLRYILEAKLSSSYGASLSKLDARELQTAWRKWQAGEANFIFEKTGYIELLQEVCKDVLPFISYEKPVTRLAYSAGKVEAHTPQGNTFEADAAILTVSLGVLKKELITFTPPLPAPKLKAIETIGMGEGLKIILKFKEKFWRNDIKTIYDDGYIADFYPSAKNDEAILTAIVMGDNARYLSNLGEEKAIQTALKALDKMFPSNLETGEQNSSMLFEKGIMIDWTTMPFQWGSYSYPSFESDAARAVLALPTPPLYFAGEATHTNAYFATVHGALETGYRAAKEVLGA